MLLLLSTQLLLLCNHNFTRWYCLPCPLLSLGLSKVNREVLTGEIPLVRYLARTSENEDIFLYGKDAYSRTEVDWWLDWYEKGLSNTEVDLEVRVLPSLFLWPWLALSLSLHWDPSHRSPDFQFSVLFCRYLSVFLKIASCLFSPARDTDW